MHRHPEVEVHSAANELPQPIQIDKASGGVESCQVELSSNAIRVSFRLGRIRSACGDSLKSAFTRFLMQVSSAVNTHF